MASKIIIVCLVVFLTICADGKNNMRTVYEWKELEFVFADEDARMRAIDSQDYIKGSSVPLDVAVHYKRGGKNRVFVTIPRWEPGRPYTLGIVTQDEGPGGPYIVPYPDPSWHSDQGYNCNGITSVYRVAIDECERLWVLDTGKLGDENRCPAQLLVFDLETDTLIHRHRIESSSLRNHSLLITPILDVRDPTEGCQDTFVYMADVTAFGIVVYDHKRNTTWRVENKLFYPYPTWGTFSIAGESFDLMDGVFGLSLSPLKSKWDDRTLYFHALASVTENFVPTSVIRNQTAWVTQTANPRAFEVFKGKRVSQAAAQAMDKNGVLYFGLATPIAVGCWDSSTPYGNKNIDIVSQDSERLQFVSGLKVVTNLKGTEEIWLVSCRFQKIFTGSITTTEVNFRILAANTKDLLWGSRCSRRPNGRPRTEEPPSDSSFTGAFQPTGYGSSMHGSVTFPSESSSFQTN